MEFGPRGVCTSSDAFPMREAGVEFTDQIRNCLFHDGHLLFAFLYCPFPQDTCSLTQSHKNIKYILCEEWYTLFVCLTLCELRSETAGILCVFQDDEIRAQIFREPPKRVCAVLHNASLLSCIHQSERKAPFDACEQVLFCVYFPYPSGKRRSLWIFVHYIISSSLLRN